MAMLVSLTSFAAEATATLSFADKAQRTVFNSNQQVWEQNGITLTNDKAASTSAVADYVNPARFYKSSKITIKCTLGTITQIVFDCNSSSYATALKSSITSGTATVSSDKVTVVPAAESDEYVIASLTGGQVRMDALTITYVVAEEDPNVPVYTITATSADATMGTVAGSGEYKQGKTVTLTANANPGYEFVKWSNEATENPLTFEATENVELTANFQAQTPISIAEAVKLAEGATCILKEFTVTYVYKSYIHIQDETGYTLAFKYDYGLKAGDKVTGFTASKTTYNGLVQLVPTSDVAALTVVEGEAPAVPEVTTAPTGNYQTVVKLINVQMPAGSFDTSNNKTVTATFPDGTKINVYNNKNITATFTEDKTYNVIGGISQYNNVIQVIAYAVEEYVAPEPEIEWIEMDVELNNLSLDTTHMSTMSIMGLVASNDMEGIEAQLFLNDYTGEDKEYVLNEASYLTYGGLEVAFIEGAMTKEGNVFTGVLKGTVTDEEAFGPDPLYVAFNLTIYKKEAVVVEISDATITVEELSDGMGGTYESITVSAKWNESTLLIEGIEKEYEGFAQIKETLIVDGVEDWYIWMCQNAVVTTVDNILTVTGEFSNNFTGDVYAVSISGALPVVEEPEVPVVAQPTRAWAYNLALAVEGNQYTFSFENINDANATLVLTNEAGEELDAIDLGAVKAGKNKVTLEASDLPENQLVSWGIKMSGEAITEMVEITDASRGIYDYYLPQDVAVDNNPLSATFGQIYVIGMDGASDGGSDRAKTQQRGVFVYNQYLDELNPTNVGYLPANAAELMTDKTRQAVHRMAVNPVTNHVAFAYNVAGATAIWSMDPANLAGDAVNLIEGLSITKANALCFDAEGTLYVLDDANTSTGGTIVKVVNGALDTIAQNAIWGVQDMSLVSDGRGGLWLAQNRWEVDAYAVLSHVNAAGEIDFKVTGESPEDVKALFPNDANASYRGQCSYNVAEDILAFGGNKVVTLFQVSYDETTGVPSISKLLSTPVLGGNIDGIAFDYAGDLYVVSASSERFYKFAVPTENNVCTTPADAKYAFQIKGEVYEDNTLNPYAFNLSSKLSADASTLTVKYSLNNSKATDVDVVIYNGEEVVAVVAGTTNMGKNTVKVPTAGLPGGVELTWAVVVNGTSVEVPTQESKMYSLYCPHGLAIDKNPESANFGRILVADAMQAVKEKSGYLGYGVGAGIHAFNPSFTTDSTVYTGGNDFTRILASNGYQPWRVKISEDGRIFVSSLDLNGVVVWEVSQDLQTWTPVIAGTHDATDHNIYDAEGNFVAGPNCSMDVVGSGEDLKLLLYSTNNKGIAFNQSGYRLDEYALGTAKTWTGTPKNIINGGAYGLVHTNVEWIYDGEGGYWFGGSRAGNAGQPNLAHVNAEGVQDYYNEDASLYGGDGVLLHDGMLIKGKARTSSTVGNIGFWTVTKDENGAPVLTEKWTIAANGIGRNLNEFAVDYANNLYAVGNSGEKIIAYALPYSGEVETPAAAKYAFQLEATEPVYEVYEDEITNLVIDYDNMVLIGGPSTAFQVDVYLGLGDYDRNTDAFQLLPESSVAIQGTDATFVEGYASVDGIDQTANAVVRCVWNGMNIELHLAMSAAPLEATKVVVENAVIEVEKYLLWGDMYDYALKMTGEWVNAEDGLTYPVLVEVPVYYPESTEAYEMYSTVTVGGWGDEDPWLGFGEGYLLITQEDNKITATGVVENPMAGIAIDITISGTLAETGLENATVTVKSVKMIKNGQLIIRKGDVEYNVNGAIVK